jgi:Uma2 family endonuclease
MAPSDAPMTTHAPLLPSTPRLADGLDDARTDQRFVMYSLPWEAYVAIRKQLDKQGHAGVRMTYLEGTLELMSPSRNHEDYKKIIARLVEAYAEERDLDLRGYGSTTFRRKAKLRGLEPDECYSIGPFQKRPDIALEVVLSSGYIDRLAVYRGLRVPEIWEWRDGKLQVRCWTKRGYEPRARSEVLPGLDLDHLASFVALDENQTRLVKAYRRSLATLAP